MKVIFLDVDGELTYMNYTNHSTAHIDIEKVKLLRQICDATGAKVVISSSWRGNPGHHPSIYFILLEILAENGIDVISNLDAYSFKETTDSEAIKDFYLWYQSSENTIRQKILLLETRSKDKLYLIHSTATTYEQNQ